MNIFKRTEDKISDFFNKSMDYNKKEGIIFLIIFFILIFVPTLIGIFCWDLLAKISIMYVIISFVLCLLLIDVENKISEYIILIYLLPYIFLLIFLDRIFLLFIPYRGDDPIIIRKYKLRDLKRKIIKKKIFFWK